VEAAVLDEDFVGVHAGYDYTGQVDTFALAFESLGIRAWTQRLWVKRDTERA